MSTTLWAIGDAGLISPPAIQLGEMVSNDRPSHLLFLGDVYEHGTDEEFQSNYEPIWGELKDITWPVLGNHCWGQNRMDCSGWKRYWGMQNYYSPGLVEGWLMMMLDSNMDCSEGSPQWEFVRDHVESWDGPMIVCLHHPRWSAGTKALHGDQKQVAPLYDLLAKRSCLILSGHDHNLQSFKPHGKLKQLVVGSGGHDLHPINRNDLRVEWSSHRYFGGLRMELSPDHCDYAFHSHEGKILHRGRWNREGHEGIVPML